MLRKPWVQEAAQLLSAYAMEDVCAVLRVGGKIPRRAVLRDGGLLDKTACVEEVETELLSRLCEIARASCGQPVHPRRTAELVESALCDNCPAAWSAIRDDLLTGDLNVDIAASVLCHNSNASAVVACLVGATSDDHRLHVACLLARVIDALPDDTRAEMGRALACQLRAVMNALANSGALMGREMRDAVLGGFGKILEKTGLPDSRTAELVLHALSTKRDELLRLFLHVSPAYLEHRPQILPLLLDRAKSAPPSCKYPVIAMLAKIVGEFPHVVKGHEAELSDIVCGALPDQLDCRECLAAATLLVAAGGCGNAVVKALARALRVCSAALVRGRVTTASAAAG